jgi:RNA polymerase sigma-70 factor, ECF subfamily
VRSEIEQVVQLVRRGDAKSLEEALALLQNTVFSFSMKVCGQRQDAEDTMQEVLLKSVPNLPKFDSAKALMVWLYKVAKNRCLMSRRKSKFAPREVLSLEVLMPDRRELEKLASDPEGTPETLLIGRERAKRLREAIQKLPPEYRLILVLRDMEELSDADIAEITGLRLGTIRVRLHRARLFVRKELAKQDHSRIIPRTRISLPETKLPAPPCHGRCKELFAELSNYLDAALDDSLCEELEKHMDGCQPCRAFLSSLEETILRCRQVANEPPDPHRAARLRRELLAQYQGLMRTIAKGQKSEVART